MRHVILTCRNHPTLRWSTKEIAVTDGRYNGARSLGFRGTPSGRGMFADGSGLDCALVDADGSPVEECDCPVDDLAVAPEDALVRRQG